MTIAILLDPVDLLFCRDGRPIVAGEGAAAGAGLPNPQVLTGAIRSALLRERGQLPADGSKPKQEHLDAVMQVRVRGPLLADLKHGLPFIPMPADLVGKKPKHGTESTPTARLRPRRGVPGWQAPPDAPQALPLWPLPEQAQADAPQHPRQRPGDTAPQQGYLTWQGFDTWAKGGVPTAEHVKQASDLWLTETRTNVALAVDTAVAADGMLFSTRYVRLKTDIGFYVEIDGADDLPTTLQLGGDRRQVQVRRLKEPVPWPAQGSVALALAPVILPQGRCPEDWKSHCTGLAISGADPVSGWDLTKNDGKGAPRPTRWTIRAGAVWHLSQTISNISIGSENETGFGWIARGIAPTA